MRTSLSAVVTCLLGVTVIGVGAAQAGPTPTPTATPTATAIATPSPTPSELCPGGGDGSGDVPKNCGSLKRFSFAAIGDQDYDASAILQRTLGIPEQFHRDPADYNRAWLDMIDDINAKDMPFAIHVGDIMLPFPGVDPSENDPFPLVDVCNATDLVTRRRPMERFNAVVLTPGDNDWAECFQDPLLESGGWPFGASVRHPGVPPAGEVNPLDLLKRFRAEFYPDPNRTMGVRPLNIDRQPDYPENVLFIYGKVMFLTMHIVGGLPFESSSPNTLRKVVQTDGCPINVYQPGGEPNPIFLNNNGTGRTDLSFAAIPLAYPDAADGGTPINPLLKENGDIDCTEQEARQAANIAWLRYAYSKAAKKGARAIVVAFQADLLLLEDGVNVIDDERREFFQPYVDALRKEALLLPIPALHIYGDSHVFLIDKPYRVTENGKAIDHLMRLQVFGPHQSLPNRLPQDQWVQVHVDATRSAISQGVESVFRFSVCGVGTGQCALQPWTAD